MKTLNTNMTTLVTKNINIKMITSVINQKTTWTVINIRITTIHMFTMITMILSRPTL